MTLTCDLNLILGSWVMCLANCLTERNIWRKFKENHPKGSGDMEKTSHSRVNLLTLACDHGLESRWAGHAICAPSH